MTNWTSLGCRRYPRGHQELYGEMYSAQRTFEAFSKLPPCEEEPVIASIMPYSDATHLANFGTASLWPLYIYFGNRSKYERAKPSANAGYHAAYFPSVPEDIKDKYKEHYGHAMPDNVMTHTKRELFHAVWGLLIDDDFVDAWMNGRALECWDKIMRRLFPRIPTYGLDYPEKVLAATIRFLARYPCPRCFILKTDIPLTGTKHDLLRRQEHREDTTQRRWRVNNAHEAIFTNGAAVDGDVVDRMLGEKSWAAIRHAFTKLAEAGADFNLFQILVVDLLHEIELGIIKVILIHLIRLLYAMNKDKIAEFNARFRRVPTFGRMTIRRFHRSVSEMKKMAARDFEDILQCLLPVAEGLFEEHDALIQRLIFRLAHWHAYAKLRLHTTATLERFHDATEKLCTTIRQFARDTEHIKTHELPREQAARGRRTAAQAAKKASAPAAPDVPEPLDTEPVSTTRREKPLNLQTYKYHSIPDYPISIPLVGTTDSTSTQIGELAHRGVKRLYARTNRRNFVKQIAVNERRIRLMRGIFDRKHQLAVQAQKRAGANGHAVEEPPAKKLKHSWRSRLRYALNGKPGLTPYTPAGAHHHISESTRTFWQIDDLPGTTHLDDDDEGDDDPALKNFMLKLRSHIRRRLEGLDDDDDVEYTPEKLLEVDFLKDRLYTHATMRVNYTTYDLQRDQDCISPRRRPDVMVLSHDPNDKHPYWYCRVLGVYHVWVRIPGLASYRKIEFLWVRWFRRDMTYRCIPDMARMPRMEFMHYEDEEAFGFLDPDHLIRGAHIIPAFHYGQTTELLPKSIVRQESEEDQDWAYYYANGCVKLFTSPPVLTSE
ncbi:hypothetical protein C8F01DRAFT_444509 [Mycena amicta]|nr:hypothetical protein C8F01DRAFT_444509 [Mycena amicta]